MVQSKPSPEHLKGKRNAGRSSADKLPRGTRPLQDWITILHPGSEISDAEWEFIQAIREYQTRFRVRYPTWREVLFVLIKLGYVKIPNPTRGDAVAPPTTTPTTPGAPCLGSHDCAPS